MTVELRTKEVYIKASKASEVVEILEAMNDLTFGQDEEEDEWMSPEGPIMVVFCPDCETEPLETDSVGVLEWKCRNCGTIFSGFLGE